MLRADTAPPTGLYLVGADRTTIPSWGFRCFTVCFSGQNYAFDFLPCSHCYSFTAWIFWDILAYLLSPPNRGPARGHGLHLRQGKYHTLYTLLVCGDRHCRAPTIGTAIAQGISDAAASTPKPLHGIVHHIDRGSVAPLFTRPRRWTRTSTASPRRSFSCWKKQALFAAPTRPGRLAAPGTQERRLLAPLP